MLQVAPGGGEVRVRSVQVHDAAVERATAGERVALGLPGVDRRDLHRGDALVTPGAFPVSYRLDVELEELVPIDGGARVSVHHGTSRIPARVARVGTQTAQLRLEAPVVAARGDRVVLRGETTLGGATVLDPAPPRRLDEERLELLERGDPASIVSATVHAPVSVERFVPVACWLRPSSRRGSRRSCRRAAGRSRRCGSRRRASRSSSGCAPGPRRSRSSRGSRSRSCCRPSPGRRRSCRCCRSSGAAGWRISRAWRPRSVRAQPRPRSSAASSRKRASQPSRSTTPSWRGTSKADGRLVRLGDGFVVSSAAYERARELVVAECTAAGEIALARFRDLAGVGRRDAQLLLERLDQDGITRRLGDRRVLRRAGRTANPSGGARGCYGASSPLGLVVDADRVRDAVDVVEVADHLDRIVDRGVVPAVRPQRVGVLQPDRRRA